MPAPNLVQLHIEVVGGELTSVDRDDGCDEDAITSIFDMSTIVTDEMSASVEECKELPVVPGPPIVSTLTNDIKLVIKSFDVIVADSS